MCNFQRTFEQTWSLKIEQKVKKQILICTSQASCLLDFSIERRDPAAGSPTATLLRLHPNR